MSASVTVLPPDSLQPNPWNPNVMTAEEFAELVAEVKHLGRLPKPVVARMNSTGYEIVDGEHGWLAAKEVGLTEIAVEIIEATDFEAMRQTYKRNQHGKHDKVREGRMFKAMLAAHGVSQRELAKQLEMSEGTVRNALTYAEAAELRNDYAFEKLQLRQVRQYLALPAPIRDYWLDAGADLEAADEAQSNIQGWNWSGRREKTSLGEGYWEHAVQSGFAAAMAPGEGKTLTRAGFIGYARQMFELVLWADHYRNKFDWAVDFALAAAEVKAPAEILDRVPMNGLNAVIDLNEWRAILRQTAVRNPGTAEAWLSIWEACLKLHLRRVGLDHDYEDPRVCSAIVYLGTQPEFIKGADIRLEEKLYLVDAEVDDLPQDALLEAKRGAIGILNSRDGWLSGSAANVCAKLGADPMQQEGLIQEVQARMRQITVQSALEEALQKIRLERKIAARDALLNDHAALLERAVSAAKRLHTIREEKIQERPAHEVLEERLRQVPSPERQLLCALLLGEDVALQHWYNLMAAVAAA